MDDSHFEDSQYYYRESTAFLKVSEVIDILERSNLLRKKKPFELHGAKSGSFIFLVDRNAYPEIADATQDHYKPWSKKFPEGGSVAPKSAIHAIGERSLRMIRATHPLNGNFKRLIGYYVNNGPVLIQYVLEGGFTELPHGKSRTLPSAITKAKKELYCRTTAAAAKVLKEQNVDVGRKTLSNLASSSGASLKNFGRIVSTNHNKLLNYSKNDNSCELSCSVGYYCKHLDNGCKSVRFMKVFPRALRLFARSLPNADELFSFREDTERLLDNGLECKLNTNNSQFVNRVGETIMIDTTFDLTDFYVTMVIGSASNFRNCNNGKIAHPLLAFMMHNTKDSVHHYAFGDYFARNMQKYTDQDQRIPNFLTDGEVALLRFVENGHDIFKDIVSVGCDVHLRSNVIDKFGKRQGTSLTKFLFGQKMLESEDGADVVKGGLLAAVTKTEYNKMIKKLEAKSTVLYDWVSKRKNIFRRHSMRSKLVGGNISRYRSTNLIENKNNILKNMLTKKVPGEDLINTMSDLHEEEYRQCLSACYGEGKYEITLNRFQVFDKQHVSKLESARVLAQLGVEMPFAERPYGIPEWFWADMAESEIADISKALYALKAVPWDSEGSQYAVKGSEKNSTAFTVTKTGRIYTCSSKQCHVGCLHVIKVMSVREETTMFAHLKEEIRNKVLNERSKTSDGAKVLRKGAPESKSNHVRQTVLARSSLFDSTLSLLSDASSIQEMSTDDSVNLPSTSRLLSGLDSTDLLSDDSERSEEYLP